MPSHEDALKATLERKGLQFRIKTGSAKWKCTVLDRTTQ
jgi:hypothetical protein